MRLESLIFFGLALQVTNRPESPGSYYQGTGDERDNAMVSGGLEVIRVSDDVAYADIATEGKLFGVLRDISVRNAFGHSEKIDAALFEHDFRGEEIRGGVAKIDLSGFRPVSIRVPTASGKAQEVVTITGDSSYGSMEVPARAGVASVLLRPGEYRCYLLGFNRCKFRIQEGIAGTTVVEFETS